MRNKKVGIGNGKWGFYFLLLTSYFLLLTLFMPEDVMAQMGQERGMRKYSLWGDITLQYDDVNTKSGGATDHRNMFTQNYKLNFRSYVLSPKIMIYTINTGFDIRTGTLYEKGTAKSYGIETVFFRNQPFNFSLHASKNDGYDYKYTSYGLFMTYTRKVRLRPIRPAAPPEEENVNRNLNINANLNENANLNANTDEEGNTNANANIVPKPRPKLERKSPSSNMFYDIINILPVTTSLNVDRVKSEFGSSKSDWRNADLRTFGVYRMTAYNLNFNYSDWKYDSGGGHKGWGGELNARTGLNWSFFNLFENNIYYRKNDITSYNINSSLTGETKKWRYGIYANYFSTAPSASGSTSESARQYSIKTDISNYTSPYIYKGVNLIYDLGAGFERLNGLLNNNKNNLFVNGRVDAKKRFGLNTDLNSALAITGSTLGTAVNFLTGISYTFRPRKGYVVSIELDPQGNTLKTRAFKPQVSGWDYSIRTGYTFEISRDTREGYSICTTSGCEIASYYTINKTIISHRGDLNVNIYIGNFTLASDATLYYSNLSKRFMWNNSIYATVMRKIGITIGTGLIEDMPEDGTKTTNYNIYNLITYRLSRTALLRLDSRYTKTTPVDTKTLEVTPSLSWAWRRVFVDLEVRLKADKTSSGAVTKERWIMMRVTRPFNIL